jgi:uncharacterized membrane protein
MGKHKKLIVDPEQAAELQKTAELRRKKVIYFIDELSILIVTAFSVLLAEAYKEMMKKGISSWSMVHFDSLAVILASMSSIIIYGILHTKIQYSDKNKPPYLKRAATAILYGIAAQSIIDGRLSALK